MQPSPGAQPFSRTKIVATYGPACADPERLRRVIQAGVDVFRLNTAHGSTVEHEKALAAIRAAGEELKRPLGILVDLAGPKMRLGELPGGQLEFHENEHFRFVRKRIGEDPHDLTVTYDPLVDELDPGDRVMLADGTVSLAVEEKAADAVVCRVVQGGLVRSRQGVNLPGAKLSAPAMSDVDRRWAEWAAKNEADFVSLSFVRSPAEVQELKQMLRGWGSRARVIAKIEKPEALAALDAIVSAADGVMVARGDLGVEIDVAQIPVAQKRIIAACNRHQKPVIIATQMLDSMQRSRWPTRAEVTDVANAILDGGDACMLSGETAVGDYPVEAVQMLNRVALATEALYQDRTPLPEGEVPVEGVHQITDAVVYGSAHVAGKLAARLIVVASHSGATALAVSKRRGFVPVIGVSDSPQTIRQMCLYWGVTPLPGAPARFLPELLAFIDHWAGAEGMLSPGDRVVVIGGSGLNSGGHNVVVVHEVGAREA
ncbi:MAG: pyruvate kinase [Pirellulales bacterium]